MGAKRSVGEFRTSGLDLQTQQRCRERRQASNRKSSTLLCDFRQCELDTSNNNTSFCLRFYQCIIHHRHRCSTKGDSVRLRGITFLCHRAWNRSQLLVKKTILAQENYSVRSSVVSSHCEARYFDRRCIPYLVTCERQQKRTTLISVCSW